MTSDQRKVLEDIQRAKRLLKEGAAVSLGMHTSTTSTSALLTATTSFPSQPTPSGLGEMMMSPGMRSAMQVLSTASMTSFGFFVPQDSHFGNSILPVLPRIEPPTVPPAQSQTSTAPSSSVVSSASTD